MKEKKRPEKRSFGNQSTSGKGSLEEKQVLPTKGEISRRQRLNKTKAENHHIQPMGSSGGFLKFQRNMES